MIIRVGDGGCFLKEVRVGQALARRGEHSMPPWDVEWERGEQSLLLSSDGRAREPVPGKMGGTGGGGGRRGRVREDIWDR